MFIDDLTLALSRAMKDVGVESSSVSSIEIDANERKKRARVNIVIENKRETSIGFWGAVVKCAPYFVILVFGSLTLWWFFRMPGCRETNVSTYAEEHSCLVTNAIGEVIKIVQDAKGCATNRWE